MLEQAYFQMYETEMIGGEVGRAVHFLERASKGKGFYSQVSSVLLDAIEKRTEPEEIKQKIMEIDGDEKEKLSIYMRFLYSVNRYDVAFPKYDSKRCNDK
ncbi:MAG: hypothetical protein M0Z77_09345 [Thermoplasmatales archaeon]|jgi:hypothetical protein|nr:hypothetical protein [Candidatus Thermoplasmatota archaeon]MDA8055831.1 hypothetical protein [Thermoplasmatales archaeon]